MFLVGQICKYCLVLSSLVGFVQIVSPFDFELLSKCLFVPAWSPISVSGWADVLFQPEDPHQRFWLGRSVNCRLLVIRHRSDFSVRAVSQRSCETETRDICSLLH